MLCLVKSMNNLLKILNSCFLIAATFIVLSFKPAFAKELINLGEIYERFVISSSSLYLEGGYTFISPDRIGYPEFEWNTQEIFDNQSTCETALLQRACKYSQSDKTFTQASCEIKSFKNNVVAKQVFDISEEEQKVNARPYLITFHSCLPMQVIVHEDGPYDPFN